MRSPIYPFVFDSVALALVTTMGVHWVLCAPRKAHGPRVITVADAKDYRMDDDYYYFGFDSEEARADANERVLVRIDEIRAEGRKKPHHLVVARLAGESIRWLILATGAFECINEGFGPVYGFDTVQDLEAAVARLQACLEFTPDIRLCHLSRPNGELTARDLAKPTPPIPCPGGGHWFTDEAYGCPDCNPITLLTKRQMAEQDLKAGKIFESQTDEEWERERAGYLAIIAEEDAK